MTSIVASKGFDSNFTKNIQNHLKNLCDPYAQPPAKQEIVPGIWLIRKLPHYHAQRVFGSRLFGSEEVKDFAEKHPKVFLETMRKQSLFLKTLGVVSDEPLGAFIQNGHLLVESEYCGEKRRLIIPEQNLLQAGIDLDQKNPFLLIKIMPAS